MLRSAVVFGCLAALCAGRTPSKSSERVYVPATHSSASKKRAEPAKTIVTEHVTISELPSKQAEPLCILPKALGLPSVTSCEDISTLGSLDRGLIHLQAGLAGCTFMNDFSCDDGSGGGMKAYRQHLKSKGYSPEQGDKQRPDAPGDCLKIEKRANGEYDVANAIRGEVLCCRAVCPEVTTTTTMEALLSLGEPDTIPYQPVTTVTTSAPAPVYTRAERPWCILPQYLDLPRVRTCEDLRDVAASTEYLTLTSSALLDCAWIADTTCDPSYPDFGRYLGSPRPHGSCIAVRQEVCNTNIIGAWPLLARHFLGLCKVPQKATYATVAIPPQKKGGRRLAESPTFEDEAAASAEADIDAIEMGAVAVSNADFDGLRELGINSDPGAAPRRLNGHSSTMAAASDSLLVCCRLDCNGNGDGSDTGAMGDLTGGSNGGSMPSPSPAVAVPDVGYTTGPTAAGSPTPKIAMGVEDGTSNSSSLCDVRYAQVCSLAAPLQGQKVIFDQHCLSDNMPAGCYAGGISRCCRSVPL